MATKMSWKPHEEHSKLTIKDQKDLPSSSFAFPKECKETLTDAAHVKNALVSIKSKMSQTQCAIKRSPRSRRRRTSTALTCKRTIGTILSKKPHTKNNAVR